ncbi:MAG: chromate transporter [Pyrinomonadaceae bacterium]
MPEQSRAQRGKHRRANKVRMRVRHVRTRARYGRRELERVARTATLGGLFLSFLKIGTVGFGGGLAVIAQIRALVVQKRLWLTEYEFAEAFALAQSLPGTSAGNTASYIGLRLRGWRGACAAMGGFILPSTLMMVLLAILYKHLRALPDTDRLFHGLNAAVVALILVTAWRMGRNTLDQRWQWILAVLACLTVAIFNATVLEVVLAAGLVGIYMDSFAEKQLQRLRRIGTLAARRRARIRTRRAQRRRQRAQVKTHDFYGGYLTRALADERERLLTGGDDGATDAGVETDGDTEVAVGTGFVADDDGAGRVAGSENGPRVVVAQVVVEQVTADADERAEDEGDVGRGSGTRLRALGVVGVAMPVLAKLGLLVAISSIFLRVGAVTFGGGFVMIPLIESEVVDTRHWLTHQEFADATALGQITPGPVLITATFIGYRVAGTLGALVATVSIFLPAFLMTVAAGSSLRRFRANRQVQAFLRGVTPAVVGLLVAAGWSIGRAGIHTWLGLSLAVVCAAVLVRFRPNPFWVIAGAGLARFLLGYVVR